MTTRGSNSFDRMAHLDDSLEGAVVLVQMMLFPSWSHWYWFCIQRDSPYILN